MLALLSLVLALLVATTTFAAPLEQRSRRAGPPTVTLSTGKIQGFTNGSLDVFLGIPYARPPLGTLRFKAPVAPESHNGTLDATSFRDACFQIVSPPSSVPPNVLSSRAHDIVQPRPDYAFQNKNFSEDCLHLNVWRPDCVKEGDDVPVLVWIHGGAFIIGAASQGLYIPDVLLQTGLSLEPSTPFVFVSFNYRLNAFGFLPSSELADADLSAGLLDQLLALRWVQKEIRKFGGDPQKNENQATVWGQSAGAASIGYHTLFSNISERLFRYTIMDSGTPLLVSPADTSLATSPRGALPLIFKATDCVTLACLQKASFKDLTSGIVDFLTSVAGEGTRFGFQPVRGGYLNEMPSCEMKQGRVGMFKGIIGTNTDEATIFIPPAATSFYTSNSLLAMNILDNSTILPITFELYDLLYPLTTNFLSPFPRAGNSNPPALNPSNKFASHSAASWTDTYFLEPRRRWCSAAVAGGGKDTFAYLFEELLPGLPPNIGVWHGSELNFLFGQIPASGNATLDSQLTALGERMRAAYIRFVATGTPNGPNSVRDTKNTWIPFNTGGNIMRFQAGEGMSGMIGDAFRDAQTTFISTLDDQLQRLRVTTSDVIERLTPPLPPDLGFRPYRNVLLSALGSSSRPLKTLSFPFMSSLPAPVTSESSPTPPAKRKRANQIQSCNECRRRRIACDKLHPCNKCSQRREAHLCEFESGALENAGVERGKNGVVSVDDHQAAQSDIAVLRREVQQLRAANQALRDESGAVERRLLSLELKQKNGAVPNAGEVSRGGTVPPAEGVAADREVFEDSVNVLEDLALGVTNSRSSKLNQTTSVRLPALILPSTFENLPPVELMDWCVRHYWDEVDWSWHLLHRPTFEAEYKYFRRILDDGRLEEVDPLWLANLFAVSASLHAYLNLAAASRMIQQLQFHNLGYLPHQMPVTTDKAYPSGVNSLRRERALRLLHSVQINEGFTFPHQPMFDLTRMRCSLPANVDDIALSSTSILTSTRPLTEVTDMSCELVKFQLDIIDQHFHQLSSRGKPDYDEILKFDRQYRRHLIRVQNAAIVLTMHLWLLFHPSNVTSPDFLLLRSLYSVLEPFTNSTRPHIRRVATQTSLVIRFLDHLLTQRFEGQAPSPPPSYSAVLQAVASQVRTRIQQASWGETSALNDSASATPAPEQTAPPTEAPTPAPASSSINLAAADFDLSGPSSTGFANFDLLQDADWLQLGQLGEDGFDPVGDLSFLEGYSAGFEFSL
ncbi:Carboxylic ester hydrolase [Pseudohyphozyma bogoriensis]|nr:Carboxylic ester hydrolase [Pseudohyphozyma bogoriensis]